MHRRKGVCPRALPGKGRRSKARHSAAAGRLLPEPAAAADRPDCPGRAAPHARPRMQAHAHRRRPNPACRRANGARAGRVRAPIASRWCGRGENSPQWPSSHRACAQFDPAGSRKLPVNDRITRMTARFDRSTPRPVALPIGRLSRLSRHYVINQAYRCAILYLYGALPRCGWQECWLITRFVEKHRTRSGHSGQASGGAARSGSWPAVMWPNRS